MTIAFGKFIKDENDLFDIMNGRLWRDRFVFVGWYSLLLFPCAYFTMGGWFTSTPTNSIANSLLLLWGPKHMEILPVGVNSVVCGLLLLSMCFRINTFYVMSIRTCLICSIAPL
jgi:hypothetical protein